MGGRPGLTVNDIIYRTVLLPCFLMPEHFLLSVMYKEQEWQFESELRVFGYTHKIAVNVNGTEIIFEPDEERNYRAVLPEPDLRKPKLDPKLIKTIAEELEATLK